jgi:apolipoprotein N-acyltransferase
MRSAPALPKVSGEERALLEARDGRLRRIYGAIALSALLSFASFHPLDLGLLAWVALVPLLYIGATEEARVGVVAAYCATVLYHLPGLSWIALTTPEGWLLTSFLEGFYGIALVCGPLWIRKRTGLPLLLTLPILGIALEWTRGNFPWIAFPWLLWGHSQHARGTLIQIADLGSVYAVSGLVLCFNGAVVDAALQWARRWKAQADPTPADTRRLQLIAAVPVALILVSLLYGVVRRGQVEAAMEANPGPRVLVVQIDAPQSLKDDGLRAHEIARANMRLTEVGLRQSAEPVDVIVWSETMWPYPIRDARTAASRVGWDDWQKTNKGSPERWRRSMARQAEVLGRQLAAIPSRTGVPLLVGAVDRGFGGRPHNSFYMLAPVDDGPAQVVARYDKIYLVPVSEGIPFDPGSFLFRFFKAFVPPGFRVFEEGALDQPLFEVGDHRFAANICFEISFPELLASFTARGATAHVCPANDAWFVRGGRDDEAIATAEVDLAKAHTRFRAIENRRPIIRCVNRGISLIMTPAGEVLEQVEKPDPKRPGEKLVVGVANALVARAPTTDFMPLWVRLRSWGLPLLSILASLGLVTCAALGRVVLPAWREEEDGAEG